MSLSELFFGGQLVNAAVNKIKGRGKIVDTNIEGGKTKKKKASVESDVERLDEIFSFISNESKSYVLEQDEYLERLSLAFKRPLVSVHNKSFRNMIFVFGPDGSGRKYSIRIFAKLLVIKKITKESSIYRLDFSKYISDEVTDKLLLPDLYKAFYGKSPIVIFENFDLACSKARSYISILGIEGVVRPDKRYSWKNGNLTESSGSYEISSSDSFGANNKYIILISKQSPDCLNRLFPKQFLDGITDILETKELSRKAYLEIAEAALEDCAGELQQRNHITLQYSSVVAPLVDVIEYTHGAHDIIDVIRKKIYESIIEQGLQGNISSAMPVILKISGHSIYAGNTLLSSLESGSNSEELAKLDAELDKIVGLGNVKEFVSNLRTHVEFERHNKISTSNMSLHMIFCGNPGTGKTTIARLIARYLKALGCLSSGHLVETSREELVGQYLGQTAPKTAEKIRSALGGILFIDEAYALSRNKQDFFGVEAIDTIVKYMEDYRDDLVVILAGYSKEMEEFLASNSGLKSRFNYIVEFPDYSPAEMYRISEIAADKSCYQIDPVCRQPLMEYFERVQGGNVKDAGNGRLARNTVEKAILLHSQRLVGNYDGEYSKEHLTTLSLDDFELPAAHSTQDALSEIDAELDKIVGLDSVKDYIRKLKNHVQFIRQSGTENNLSLHMIFCGNPGTGKTTIARIVAKYFNALGILSKGHLVEVSRSDLVAGFVGQTAIKVMDIVQSALGGVLFIDEAYSLVNSTQDSFGKEAVDTLVKAIEDNRNDLVVILAGYTKEMNQFLKTNSGIRSRFNYTLEFPDYTPEELLRISEQIASSSGYSIDGECHQSLLQEYARMQGSDRRDAGNGRLARNTVEKAIFDHSQHIAEIGLESVSKQERYLLSSRDFGFSKEKTLSFDLEAELSTIVGLESVKDHLRSLYATLFVNRARAQLGISEDERQTLHMVFMGNPGTGKTTMARIVANLLHEMEILPTNKLIETDRSALVAGYVGQTAEKTLAVLEQARGGVIFIDEAYSLASGGENDFGIEAIDTIVKYMEDHRDDLVVILAGYTREMQTFMAANSGLLSRFPTVIEFPDYSSAELLQLIEKMYNARHFVLHPATRVRLLEVFDVARNNPHFGNGRFARNLCEQSIRKLSIRITKSNSFTKEALTTILPEDI